MSRNNKVTPVKKINQSLNRRTGSKKLNPKVRTVILVDMVALSMAHLLANYDLLSQNIATGASVVGAVALVIALGVQFMYD